jgi:hypothetical protein
VYQFYVLQRIPLAALERCSPRELSRDFSGVPCARMGRGRMLSIRAEGPEP